MMKYYQVRTVEYRVYVNGKLWATFTEQKNAEQYYEDCIEALNDMPVSVFWRAYEKVVGGLFLDNQQ